MTDKLLSSMISKEIQRARTSDEEKTDGIQNRPYEFTPGARYFMLSIWRHLVVEWRHILLVLWLNVMGGVYGSPSPLVQLFLILLLLPRSRQFSWLFDSHTLGPCGLHFNAITSSVLQIPQRRAHTSLRPSPAFRFRLRFSALKFWSVTWFGC